ncbi:hypothetical protein RDABS01_027348 [Bienertia sinuspersici]
MSSRSGSRSNAINNGDELRIERCYCGVPVARLVSWTERNPGRRFRKCKFHSGREDGLGCNYWRWTNHGILEWQRDVTNQLLAENRALRTEVANYKEMLQARDNGVNEANEVQMVVGGGVKFLLILLLLWVLWVLFL